MAVHSKMILLEKVNNNDNAKKFGSSDEYFPAYSQTASGEISPLLFTESQLRVARERAKKMMEESDENKKHFYNMLFSEYQQYKRQMGEF